MSLCGNHGCAVCAVGVLWGCRLYRMDFAGFVGVWFVRVEFYGGVGLCVWICTVGVVRVAWIVSVLGVVQVV